MSLPVSFFTTALMFVTLSLAISERPPVAMTCPERPWAGVTMASTGRTTPEKSDRPLSAPRTARPLILPTLVPRLTSIAYSDWLCYCPGACDVLGSHEIRALFGSEIPCDSDQPPELSEP